MRGLSGRRRQQLRLRASGKGHYAVIPADNPDRSMHSGRFVLADLSAQGARVEVVDMPEVHVGPLVAGQRLLTVLFDDVTGSPVRPRARVRWVERDKGQWVMGLEFVELSEQDALKIRAYLYRLIDEGDATRPDPFALVRRRRRHVYAAVVAAAAALGLLIGGLVTSTSWSEDGFRIAYDRGAARIPKLPAAAR